MGMLHPNKGSSADALPCTTQAESPDPHQTPKVTPTKAAVLTPLPCTTQAESPDPHQTPKVTQTKAAVLSSLHHIRASDIVNQEYKMEEQ